MNTSLRNRKNSLEILSVDLLNEKELFSIFRYWSKCLGKEVGWHYSLDLIWIIKKIKELKLSHTANILDAGAGNGLSQFLLAYLGYNVLSVDFIDRSISIIPSLIFNIKKKDKLKHKFQHSYISYIKDNKKENKLLVSKIIAKLNSFDFRYFLKEVIKRKKRYGSITFYKADFRDMKEIPNNSIDCIVSVSALEHNKQKDIKKAVTEFNRVLKPNGVMFLTTSATDRDDWFHKPSQGWCFSEKTLIDLFSLNNPDSNFDDYAILFQKLKNSQYLQENLSSYYFHSEKGGMPWGKWNPLYQPVGITKYKQ